MKKIGEDITIVFSDVVKYLPAASNIAALLFPGNTGEVSEVVNAVQLVIQTVTTVEQKFAALGTQSQTGAQKLAQVLSIVTPTLLSLLAKAGITADASLVTQIVNGVVAILNIAVVALPA